MPNGQVTIEQATVDLVLGLDASSPSWRQLSKLEAGKCLTALRKQLPPAVPPGYWGAVLAQIGEKVHEALNLPLTDVLAGAWKGYGRFLKYCDRKQYPPDKVSVVALADHTITSSHKPHVDVLVNNREFGRIDFDVELVITLKGANLSIRDGKFIALRLASGKAKGTLSCEGVVLIDRSSREFQLPGELRFGEEGVPIV